MKRRWIFPLLGLLVLGFGSATASTTDAQPSSEAADAAILRVAHGLAAHEPQVAWQALPASYRTDLTEIVHEAADKADAELWNRSFGVLRKVTRLLSEKRQFIIGHPMVAQHIESENVDENWEALVGLMNVVVQSDLADVEKLKTIDIGQFLAGTGAEFLEKSASLAALSKNGDLTSQINRFADARVSVLSSEGDRAMVRIERPGQTTVDEEFVRIEGSWVPKKMADAWPAQMDEVRKGLADYSAPEMSDERAAVLMQLSMIDGALDQVLAAETPEQFQATAAAAMGAIFGAMMAQAAAAGAG